MHAMMMMGHCAVCLLPLFAVAAAAADSNMKAGPCVRLAVQDRGGRTPGSKPMEPGTVLDVPG